MADCPRCSSSVLLSSNMPITIPTGIMPFNRFGTPSNLSEHLPRLGASECQMQLLRLHRLMLPQTFSMTRSQSRALIGKFNIGRDPSGKERIRGAGRHRSSYRIPSRHPLELELEPEPKWMRQSGEVQSLEKCRRYREPLLRQFEGARPRAPQITLLLKILPEVLLLTRGKGES